MKNERMVAKLIQYLKKKKLYAIARELVTGEMPLCKEFDYKHYHGVEWLITNSIRVSAQCSGQWIRIERNEYDEQTDESKVINEIFSNFKNGTYQFHSIDGKVVLI